MSTQQVNGSAVTSSSTVNDGGSVINGGSTTSFNSVDLGYSDVGVFGAVVVDGTDTDKALSAGTFAYDNQRPVAKRVTETLSGVSNTVLQSGADQPGLMRSIHKRESYRVKKTSTAFRSGYWDQLKGQFVIYGTYARVGSTVTVTAPNHGLATNDNVYLDFTSGGATDGRFQVTVTDANIFTLTHGTSGSTSGNVTVKGPADATESPGTDEAATPSRSVPGELTYKTGAAVPVQDNYAAKTGWLIPF